MKTPLEQPGSEEVELYMRTYYSLLRSNSDVQIRTLEHVHAGMHSLLHPGAEGEAPDMSAFIYTLLRLPDCIQQVTRVVLGQSCDIFRRSGVGDVETWQIAAARARRRRCYFDGEETLACIVASHTDIDDIIPILTAYQIEWNKLHRLLNGLPDEGLIQAANANPDLRDELAAALLLSREEMDKLHQIWGEGLSAHLAKIASRRCHFHIQLLNSTMTEYRRATHGWWKHIESALPGLLEQPVYFISSNTHSMVNLLSGFALKKGPELLDFLNGTEDSSLQKEWTDIQERTVPSRQENFLYYLLKKYLSTPEGQRTRQERRVHESRCGILRIDSEHFFDVDAQVVELAQLKPEWLDPRLQGQDLSFLKNSDAMILNIDYPLGLAAYNILSKIAEQAFQILGIYIMGKAATLNGVIGDVMIPNVVHDEHSHNTFYFANAFSSDALAPYLIYGTCLDNQKSVTVRGTFLQNASYMDVFYRESYTDIEMEAGPYLSALYEMSRPKRHPVDRVINLHQIPFDVGIAHYASDTPLGKGKNLGSATLSYFGMDPTYAVTVAVIRRIFALERARLAQKIAHLSPS